MRERLKMLLKESSQYICDSDSLIDKIADHLLAEGVIVPPCKVGDVLYYLGGFDGEIIHAKKVEEIRFGDDGFVLVAIGKYMDFCLQESEIFLTREEAEQALAKMKGGAE